MPTPTTLTVTLSSVLPSLLDRVDLLPLDAEVIHVRQSILFAMEQYPSQSHMNRMRFAVANTAFVSELERRAGINGLIAEEQGRRIRMARARRLRPEPEWHVQCVDYAKKLLATGRERHVVTAICAKRYGHGAKAVRTVLKKEGVLT